MSEPSNILHFPKKKVMNSSDFSGGPVETQEDVNERIQAVKHIHIDGVLEAIIETVIQQLIVGGFDTCEDDAKGVAFVAESIRSLMSLKYDIYHPFHDIMEEILIQNDDDVFVLADNIHVYVDDGEDVDEEAPGI